jgi:protein SCO1/2
MNILSFLYLSFILELMRSSLRRFCSQLTNRPKPIPTPETQRVQEPLNNARPKKSNSYAPNFEFTIAQAGLVVASGLAILGMVKMGDIAMERRKRASQTAIVSEEQVGKPKLGGPWTLYDCKTAKPFTSEDLKGRFQLVYFGFTYCPDVCPEEMQKQATVVETVEKALKGTELEGIVQPVFITVDPKRDTLAQTRMYIKEFHPKLLGLTGAPEQVKKVTRLFRVYYNEGIRTTNPDGEEDYLVDHSIIHYLMGPDNQLVDFYGKNYTAEEMSQKVLNEIHKYRKCQEEKKNQRKTKSGISDI